MTAECGVGMVVSMGIESMAAIEELVMVRRVEFAFSTSMCLANFETSGCDWGSI